MRDVTGQLAALAFSHVTKEPVVRHGSGDEDGLICDLAVRGVWNPQTEALLDVRVVNTDAQSYVTSPVVAVLGELRKGQESQAPPGMHGSSSRLHTVYRLHGWRYTP